MTAPAWLSLLDGFEVAAELDQAGPFLQLSCLACGERVGPAYGTARPSLGTLARDAQQHSGQCGGVR